MLTFRPLRWLLLTILFSIALLAAMLNFDAFGRAIWRLLGVTHLEDMAGAFAKPCLIAALLAGLASIGRKP